MGAVRRDEDGRETSSEEAGDSTTASPLNPLERNRRSDSNRRSSIVTRVLQYVVGLIKRFLSKIWGFLFNHRYHLDDIIMIIRPFIYVYSVMKYGRKSYTPIKISLALDIISILVTLSRLIQAASPQK